MLGGVLVALAVAGCTVALAVDAAGDAAHETTDTALVPADLAWTVRLSCLTEIPLPTGTTSAMIDESGVVTVESGGHSADPGEVRAFETRATACLQRFRFDPHPVQPDVGFSRDPGERLFAYGFAMRWTIPCLAAHGRAPRIPTAAEYLDPERTPWRDFYEAAGPDDLDAMLAARHACGPGFPVEPAR